MKAILVPTDFSETSRNAARYAISFAKEVGVPKIILFNAYQAPYSADPTMPVLQLFDFDEVKNNSTTALNLFKSELLSDTPPGIAIETKSDFAILAESIADACAETGADLIIMGITGGTGIDVLVGSNTISVADQSKVPVIIVPSRCQFKSIQNLVLVCNYNSMGASMPVRAIRTVLDETHARLNVLTIGHVNKQHTPDSLPKHTVLNDLLGQHEPRYHFVDSKSFSEAVNQFVEQNQVDMIITIPKKHGFFESIFRRNHTRSLAFHTHVPLMCIHEEKDT